VESDELSESLEGNKKGSIELMTKFIKQKLVNDEPNKFPEVIKRDLYTRICTSKEWLKFT